VTADNAIAATHAGSERDDSNCWRRAAATRGPISASMRIVVVKERIANVITQVV